jgi:hypothetical protein
MKVVRIDEGVIVVPAHIALAERYYSSLDGREWCGLQVVLAFGQRVDVITGSSRERVDQAYADIIAAIEAEV